MKPVLVTGATGFVGWHVARKLLDRSVRVRLLVRDPSRVRDLDGAEVVQGDLRDAASLARAVSGCGVIYHVAADYRLWAKVPAELFQSNVGGTRSMLQAAEQAGAERIVYTSTVGCIGIPAGGIGDESTPVSIEEMSGAYKRSKFVAEQVALEFAANELPVVIVNPTAPIGDHDFRPTPTGKIVVDFLKRQMPAYVDTGLNVLDVKDAAEGHLLACERGRSGERYILGSANMTLRDIFFSLERLTGIPAPRIRIPYAVAYAAGVVSTAWAGVSGQEPRAPIDAVRMARKKMWVNCEKARRELGFSPGPPDNAFRSAAEWFRANGYV